MSIESNPSRNANSIAMKVSIRKGRMSMRIVPSSAKSIYIFVCKCYTASARQEDLMFEVQRMRVFFMMSFAKDRDSSQQPQEHWMTEQASAQLQVSPS